MKHESLVNRDWSHIVARLGGAANLDLSARETKAFLRARVVENAVDLLRMSLAHTAQRECCKKKSHAWE